MAQVYHRTRTFNVSPTARATNETIILMAVKKGWRIIAVAMEKQILGSTANTIALRVATAGGGAAAGLMAATDTSAGAVKDIAAGVGADLATSGGYLVTADSTLDATYAAVGGGGTITPSVRVSVTWVLDPIVSGLNLA